MLFVRDYKEGRQLDIPPRTFEPGESCASAAKTETTVVYATRSSLMRMSSATKILKYGTGSDLGNF